MEDRIWGLHVKDIRCNKLWGDVGMKVLLPHVVSVEGNAAKANMFKVAAGYIIRVMLGGSTREVQVTVNNNVELFPATQAV
jgi:hypothetical protein